MRDNHNSSCSSYRITRWAIDGRMRFLSHRDLLNFMGRLARRCRFPVHYSHGYNPRPAVSLPVPKPVGVAGVDERLILGLDSPIDGDPCETLNAHSPEGMAFIDSRTMEGSRTIHPFRLDYRLHLDSGRDGMIQEVLNRLRTLDSWPIVRSAVKKRRGRRSTPRTVTVDLKQMVKDISWEPGTVFFSCVPREGKWARPDEILGLIGLKKPHWVSRLVRTNIHDDVLKD